MKKIRVRTRVVDLDVVRPAPIEYQLLLSRLLLAPVVCTNMPSRGHVAKRKHE